MSRIGKQKILIPPGVEVIFADGVVKVKGSKGELTQRVKGDVNVLVRDGVVSFESKGLTKEAVSLWGLYRALVANMIKGVTVGFRKDLEIIGIGYRAAKIGNDLTISIGYSKPVEFKAPQGITLDVEDSAKISVQGADKDLVGLTAAKIRAIRRPEPYKGKGIKYATEVVRRKAGKAAAAKTAA